MAATSGRNMRIAIGGTTVAAARTDNLSINNEPVDITDKDDTGWRTMLSVAGVRSIDADIEGVVTDAVLIGLVMDGTPINAATITITGLGVFAGDFYLSAMTLGAAQADAVTFTANLLSSGAITWTAS